MAVVRSRCWAVESVWARDSVVVESKRHCSGTAFAVAVVGSVVVVGQDRTCCICHPCRSSFAGDYYYYAVTDPVSLRGC